MTALIVLGAGAFGGVIGGYIGVGLAMAFADMEPGSLDAVAWIAGAAMLGAAVGVCFATELAT